MVVLAESFWYGKGMLALLILAAAHQATPAKRVQPHTLVIVDGDATTRMDYRTAAACIRARDEVRRQVEPPPNRPGVIYGRPTTKAFCVPR